VDEDVSLPWAEAVGPVLQIDVASDLLGVSPNALRAMAARNEVLEIVTTDRVPLYPAWQFGTGTVVPGLIELLTALAPVVDGWTLASWCRLPQPELDGRSVADALAEAGSRSSQPGWTPGALEARVRLVAARTASRWSR